MVLVFAVVALHAGPLPIERITLGVSALSFLAKSERYLPLFCEIDTGRTLKAASRGDVIGGQAGSKRESSIRKAATNVAEME